VIRIYKAIVIPNIEGIVSHPISYIKNAKYHPITGP